MLWNAFFSVYNEILYHLRYYHGGDDATQLYVLKEEYCGFCWIFYSYFKIILDPLSFCWIWIAEEGMCSEANKG